MTRRRAIAGGAAAAVAGLGAVLGLRGRVRTPEGVVRDVERYADSPQQDGEWWVPAGQGRLPTVVLVHGGYWRAGYDRSLEEAVAADLSGRGFLVWNLDYRPSTAPWPTTLSDTALAYDHLVRGRHADRVDPQRVAVVGHSAGGHLALWLAARHLLPPGAPGADPRGPRPALAVGQAPVAALDRAAAEQLGGGAVQALLGGGPDDVPDRYAVADPTALGRTGVPTVCLHGVGDDVVPLSQSEVYAAATGARVRELPGGHFTHLDPGTEAVAALRQELERL